MKFLHSLDPSHAHARAGAAFSFVVAMAACACGDLQASEDRESTALRDSSGAGAETRVVSDRPNAASVAPSTVDVTGRLESREQPSGDAPPRATETSGDVQLDGEVPDLLVKRLVITSKVEDREPTPGGAPSAGGGPVVAFLELANSSDEERSVVVTFERAASTSSVGHVRLAVPARAARWRTWGLTHHIDSAGTWEAIIRTPDGTELARHAFEVTS